MVSIDTGIILIGLCSLSAIGGLSSAIIGGIFRFNIAYYVNDYLSDFKSESYNKIAGGWGFFESDFDDADLGGGTISIGALAIALGVVVILYSTVGIMAGLMKQGVFLFVLIGSILLSKILAFILLWMIVNDSTSFHDHAKDQLGDRIKDEYKLGKDINDFSILLNSLMMAGQCCGVRGSSDFGFNNKEFINSKNDKITVTGVPPPCCKYSTWSASGDQWQTCGADAKNTNSRGCYEVLFDAAADGLMGSCVIGLIFLLLWQCIIILTAALMVLQPRAEEELAKAKVEVIEAPEVEKKIFTPFSKLSSFQSADMTRIKSTEIW